MFDQAHGTLPTSNVPLLSRQMPRDLGVGPQAGHDPGQSGPPPFRGEPMSRLSRGPAGTQVPMVPPRRPASAWSRVLISRLKDFGGDHGL